MKCNKCNKEANHHITEVRGGKITKRDFCEEHCREHDPGILAALEATGSKFKPERVMCYGNDITEYVNNLYLMIVNDSRIWFSMRDAGVVYDNGWATVRHGGSVIDLKTGRERPITDREKYLIGDIADEYSASK